VVTRAGIEPTFAA